MKKYLGAIEWFVLCIWIGGSWVVSFWIIPQAFSILPKPLSGEFTASLFPVYFAMQAIGFLTVASIHARNGPLMAKTAQAKTITLALMGLALALNLFIAAPQTNQTIKKLKTAHPKNLVAEQKHFRKWHGISMAANLVVLLASLPLILLTWQNGARVR